MNDLLKVGTSSLVPALFGDKSGCLVNALSSASGIKTSSATNLLAMIVPLVLTFLKKFIGDKGLNASSLATLLGSQGPNLQGALDSRLTGALGFASPAAFLGGLGGQAADAAKRAGAAVACGAGAAASTAAAAAAATKSGPDALAALDHRLGLLLLLWNMFSGKPAPTPAPAPGTEGGGAGCRPSGPGRRRAAGQGLLRRWRGRHRCGRQQGDRRRRRPIKKDSLKVAITGYTDKTGDVAKNEELAKARARPCATR